jgi:hypothetical protein
MEENIENKDVNAEGTALATAENTNTDSNDSQEFDATAFVQGSLTSEKPNDDNDNPDSSDDNSNNAKEGSDDDSDNPDNTFVWNLEEEEEENSNKPDITDDGSKNGSDSPDAGRASEETTAIDYETLSNELGIEVKSKEDLIQKYNDLKNQVEEARQLKEGVVTNKKIEAWQSYINLDDEKLVAADLKAQGFNADEIAEALDVYKDNGTLSIEGKKIRKTLSNYISQEQKTVLETKNKEAEKSSKEAEEARKNIKAKLDTTETMFGFKIAKDETELTKVRQNHYKYITEKFLSDITSNEDNIIKASWLWRNKDTILNSLKNSGVQKGKEEVIRSLTNPDVGTSTRIIPGEDKGFDPKKFISGSLKL